MTRYLTTEDLLAIIDAIGDLPVRDVGLLDSAAHRPASTVFGDEAYPDVHLKAAVLMESIVRNQPLVDGNKRLGWTSAVVFLGLNDIALDAPFDDAYDLVISVAEGRCPAEETAAAFRRWS